MTQSQAIGSTSQVRLTPYVSVPMLKYHQRRGVRFDDLVVNGKPADNDAALAGLIEEASARADTYLLQVLAATMDTVLDTVTVNRRGYAAVHPRYRPIIGVTAVAMGATANTLIPYADLSGVAVQTDRFVVPSGPTLLTSSAGPLQFGAVTAPMDQAWIRYTYCNGFPVTELTAPPAAGATTLDVLDTTGVIGGATRMTVYSGATRHRFLVTAVSTAPAPGQLGTGPGALTITPALPFAVPTLGPYPVMVSALPADVISAVGLIMRGLVKTGGGGNVTAQTNSGNRKVKDPYGAGDDFSLAERMLDAYAAVVE